MSASLCIIGSSLLVTVCVVRAELEASLLLGYASQYVDRGEFLGKDLFHLGFEPYGAIEVEGVGELEVTAGLWQGSFTGGRELNLYGEVYKDLGSLGAAVGITHSSFSGMAPGSDHEIETYLLMEKTFSGLSLGAGAYFDASDSLPNEVYLEFTADYAIPLGSLTLDLVATYGYFDDGVAYSSLGAALEVPMGENVRVVPHLTGSHSRDLGDWFFGGVGAHFSF